jgi:hypothetical protein
MVEIASKWSLLHEGRTVLVDRWRSRSQRTRALLVAVSAGTLLAACSLIEPSSESRFTATPGTPTEVVFACVESTLRSLKADRGTWSDATTTRDIDNGLLETSDFNKSNIVGIRAQVRYASASGDGRIKIKASGPYFTDLGADQAAKQLATGMARCL